MVLRRIIKVENNMRQCVEAVRRFNRFYTKQIGVLHERLLRSPFPLTEARVIYEIAHHEKTTATELCNELGLDAGYLSRILRSFKKRSLINKQLSQTDGRQNLLSLTERGQEAFATLNARSHNEVVAMLSNLSATDQNRLVKAMHSIEDLLDAQPKHKTPYLLRVHPLRRPPPASWSARPWWPHGLSSIKLLQLRWRFCATLLDSAASCHLFYCPNACGSSGAICCRSGCSGSPNSAS